MLPMGDHDKEEQNKRSREKPVEIFQIIHTFFHFSHIIRLSHAANLRVQIESMHNTRRHGSNHKLYSEIPITPTPRNLSAHNYLCKSAKQQENRRNKNIDQVLHDDRSSQFRRTSEFPN